MSPCRKKTLSSDYFEHELKSCLQKTPPTGLPRGWIFLYSTLLLPDTNCNCSIRACSHMGDIGVSPGPRVPPSSAWPPQNLYTQLPDLPPARSSPLLLPPLPVCRRFKSAWKG